MKSIFVGTILYRFYLRLQLDNNRLCDIEGTPFEKMNRLRMLSLRDNKMTSLAEPTFNKLRSSILYFDIEGKKVYKDLFEVFRTNFHGSEFYAFQAIRSNVRVTCFGCNRGYKRMTSGIRDRGVRTVFFCETIE